jgi:hypothetical protein
MAGMNRPGSGIATIFIGLLLTLLLLVAYVLSAGPAVYLSKTGVISFETVRFIYTPLGWIENRSPGCRNVLEWYGGLWRPNRPQTVKWSEAIAAAKQVRSRTGGQRAIDANQSKTVSPPR